MSWEGRNAVIYKLRMDLATAKYNVQRDIRPLQKETIEFLQREVDKAYQDAVREYKGGAPPGSLAWSASIGRSMDNAVREKLRLEYNASRAPYGPGQIITVNNRDVRSEDQTYKIPDARLGDMSIDWTLTSKSLLDAQVRGFFRADSSPNFVVIIRPTQLGGSYMITRPAGNIRRIDDVEAI
jgi:hypothetical protein